jgi:hypothetical protein
LEIGEIERTIDRSRFSFFSLGAQVRIRRTAIGSVNEPQLRRVYFA